MTPSQWEQGTSLEHDMMQADVLECLRSSSAARTIKRNGKDISLSRIRVKSECMLAMPTGLILGFVDIMDFWGDSPDPKKKTVIEILAFEIKPRITSAGGIVRQLKATELAIERWLAAGEETATINIAPIVPLDDPNVSLLRRLWSGPVFLWDAGAKTLT